MRNPFSATYARIAASACALLLPATAAHAAIKFTEPTAAELQMTAEPKAPGAAAIILSYEETDDGGSAEVTVHVRIKILTSGGISAGTIEIPDGIVANDTFRQIFEARTIHASGVVIPFTGSPTNTSSNGSDYTGRKVIAMPDVQVGSIVEYAYHFEGQNSFYSYLIGYYAPVWRVQRNWFVRSAHFILKTPDQLENDSTRWVANLPPGAALKRTGSKVDLTLADVPAMPDEEFMPPVNAVLYNVRFFYFDGTREKYWGTTGERVDDRWSDYDSPRKGLVAVVHDLILPTDTDQQKLQKIYAAVERLENTDFTRQHSESEDKKSGLHEAKNSEDIWNRKRGDSDDLTHLFIALVRAAGYKAYPLAVASRNHAVFDQNVLSWSQMDSMLAVVTVGDHEVFFDPGIRMCPFGDLAPWHSNVVGVSTEKKLIKIRSTITQPYAASRIERRAEMTLAANGTVSGNLRITWIRTAGLSMRDQALREDAHQVETDLEKRIQGQIPSGVQVHLESLKGLADGEAPLVANFTVSGSLGVATQKRVVLPAQFFASSNKPQLAAETRTQPINFPSAYATRDQVAVHLPAELSIESVPQPQSLRYSTDTQYEANVQTLPTDPHLLVAQRAFVLNRVDYQAQEYDGLHKYFGRVANADQEQIVLHRAETTAQVSTPQ